MTYGCLLRPHREIRELIWNDFSDDLGVSLNIKKLQLKTLKQDGEVALLTIA